MSIRWLIDVGPLWDSPAEFTAALSLIPQPSVRADVERYHRLNDRKLALASQFLQRLCVSTLSPSKVKFADVVLERENGIKGGKPVASDGSVEFNVSHHGRLVACAARTSSKGRLGIDVVDVTDGGIPAYARDEGVKAWIEGFAGEQGGVFTDGEMDVIRGDYRDEGNLEQDKALARRLYRNWCAKEAYVKAVGTGLVTELLRLEIRGLEGFSVIAEGEGKNHRYSGIEACVKDEGSNEWRKDIKWKFDIERVRAGTEEYYVCVAFEGDSFAKDSEWKYLDFEQDVIEVVKSQ